MTITTKKIYFISGTMCDERLWTNAWKSLSTLLPASTEFIHLPIPSLKTIDEITEHLSQPISDSSYLVGFSLGGYLASNIALKHPDKIAKLLLVSNMSSALPEKEKKERARTIQWIKSNGYSGIPDKRIHHLLHPSAHTNELIKQTIRAMDQTLGKNVLLHQLDVTTQRKNLLPELFKLNCPIKFCVGDSDCLVKLSRIEKQIDEAITQNKTLKILKNTGHMLPLEQPQLLAHTISEWFLDPS
ncbi:alpha/beta fold hydrolase [Colwellia sp. RE-S-Sl-9]